MKHLILVTYVDDVGIGAKVSKDIDWLIERLRHHGFTLEREGSFVSYLGIKLDNDTTAKTITLTQPGLIKKIIKAAGMESCSKNHTPTCMQTLGLDPDGEPMDDAWDYRSIIGMLLYLSTNTRSDISLAVSQVARFSNAPKKSHATAVKTIIRYLKKTADCGMILKVDGTFNLDVWADADFCGLYRSEPARDPNSAHSCMGYIIFLGGCPLLWKSQLMSEIVLSTQESKYGALSQALHQLVVVQ